MSFGKALQSVTVFIVIPLMLAVHSNKITLQAALDLIVWYIAVAFFIYIFKTPLKLYFIVKDKALHLKDLQQIHPDSKVVKTHIQELFSMEWKLLIVSILCPFIALFSWYSLEVFCVKYSLSTLSHLLHPYFIIIACFVTTYQPIFFVLDHFKKRMDELYSGVDAIDLVLSSSEPRLATEPASPNTSRNGATHMTREKSDSMAIEFEVMKKYMEQQLKQHEEKMKQDARKHEKEMNAKFIQLQNELGVLKRDIREWSSKKSAHIQTIESRIFAMENQFELYQMITEKQKTEAEQQSNSSMSNLFKYVPTPTSAFKLLSSR